jgi:hypothetical protein
MALVGEARIKVVADTSGVKEQIRRGFRGATAEAETAANDTSKAFNNGLKKSLGEATRGMSSFQRESKQLASSFHSAIRSSYKMQAAIGAIIPTLEAAGGGLLALAGNMAGAASSGVVLVGIMAQMKLASLVAKQAFHGISQAVQAAGQHTGKTLRQMKEEMQQLGFAAEGAALSEEKAALNLEKARMALAQVQSLPPNNRARREAELAYKEADLAYRKAKDHAADLQEQIANPKLKKKGKGQDPYFGLTQTQRVFAQYLASVQPKMKQLREAAASSFLPELEKQMKSMFKNGYFKMLITGFKDISSGLAKAVKGFAGTLFDPSNKKNFSDFMHSTSRTVASFGPILGKVFSGFLTLMKAIDPLISRFTLFLDKKSTKFASGMKGDFANIQAFFKNAGDAAAGWGSILGRVFEKFKNMIKANIGPGSGGQLLLDYFNRGQAGFRGLDGAAGDFARKQHFLAVAANLKAILDSVSKIFGFMSDLGTDPAVASFWNILSELEGPLSQIFSSIQGSSDELANLLVSVLELVASFADSGQLKSYMTFLSAIFRAFAAVMNTISPIMKALGPLNGIIGALVTTMLLLSKATKIVYGTWLIFTGAIGSVVRVFKIYRTALILNTAAESFATRVKEGFLLLLTKEGRLQAWNALKTAFSASAKTVDAAATAAVGGASAIATPEVAAFSAAVNSAIWPLTLIAIAIGAVVLAIVGLVSWMNQIKADNIKKASKEINKEFDNTRGKIIGAADAQRQWTAALLAVGPEQKGGIEDIKQMGKVLNDVTHSYYATRRGVYYQTAEYRNATEVMDTYITNLAKLAKKNLPEAQRQIRNMVVASGMNRKATENAILANKNMTDALEKQAKAMGDTIMNADGTVNAMKAVDYAIGEGSYVRQKARLEQQKFAETFKNAAKSFIDTNASMQAATVNGKFSLTTYLKDLKKQGEAVTKWRQNISTLNSLFTDKKALEGIIAQGAAGADLVDSLARGGKQAVDNYTAAQSAASAATKDAETFAAAFGDTTAVTNLIKKTFSGSNKSWMLKGLQAQLDQGMGALELAAKYNINEKDIIAEQKRLQGGADLASTVNLTAKWDADALAQAKADLKSGLGDVTLTTKKNGGAVGPKNGGQIVKRALGGIVGKAMTTVVPKFADGWGPSYSGKVYGPGTGRSDQIPAMISNGEFVMNARATAQNLALLNAMNKNQNVSGMAGHNVAITVNAAPGMDESQVASLVAYQLRNELRKGATI